MNTALEFRRIHLQKVRQKLTLGRKNSKRKKKCPAILVKHAGGVVWRVSNRKAQFHLPEHGSEWRVHPGPHLVLLDSSSAPLDWGEFSSWPSCIAL